ncbi:MAG: flippase-like domain-containing protein [Muribaculaceae bacterium]|nr:flippase-like domain-containing protein [Muribaculaceae bacterium]
MKKALQYILPVILSVLLIWYLFRKVDFRQTMEIISHGVDYWWILAAMGISIFSHIFRAMRWRIQLNALHVKTTLMELTCGVFGCYALNLLLPRVGELWRCTFVARRSRAQFTTVMGSMVADRMADSVMVLLLILLTFVIAAPALASFMAKYPVGENILNILYSPTLWIAGIIAIGIVCWILRRFRDSTPVAKLRKWIGEIWNGFAITVTMPGKWKFLMLTLAIWGCYFVQLYVAFYAFSFTRALCHEHGLGFGLLPCLVAFVFSSIGMAVPSNGGLGPWNIAIMFGLAIYGVADVEGAAFSILQWSGQTVMLIILGIFTAIWIGATSSSNSIQHKTGLSNEIRRR